MVGASESGDGARLGGADRHRLLDEYMQAPFQCRDRVGAVQVVRRGDDERVHRRLVEHRGEIFRAVGDAEDRLHFCEFGPAEAANRDQVHVGAGFQDGQVVGDRPPARAHDADPQLAAHAHSPMPGPSVIASSALSSSRSPWMKRAFRFSVYSGRFSRTND